MQKPIIGTQRVVSIRYFAPHASLRAHISSYYLFTANLPLISDLLRAELGQVRFLLAGSGVYRFGDGHVADCPQVMLTGPTNAPIEFTARGPLRVFGVGLLPAGWSALIGAPAAELADGVADYTALAGPAARDCLERLGEAADDAALVGAADRLFGGLAARSRAVPWWFTRLTDEWLTGDADPHVDDLIAASRMSARQLERLAVRIYGASPKLLARKYRTLRAAVRLGTGAAQGWADAAGEAFYDQSHFIREFKQFIGMTPTRFVEEAAPVVRLTIARQRLMPGLPRLAFYS